MSTQRPMREMIVQMVARVMIPITVASMGWYYTRWQQNLADLKTMIDLVSDESPERQKYGIAMFEYLLKNDKVPVEFVAAQLDYANSASDPELLTLMESALLKASEVNPSVAAVFTEAVERLPARIFVHVTSDEQRACVRTLITSLKDTDKITIAIPAITKAKWDGKQKELRVLKDADVPRAKALAAIFCIMCWTAPVQMHAISLPCVCVCPSPPSNSWQQILNNALKRLSCAMVRTLPALNSSCRHTSFGHCASGFARK